MDDSVSEWNQTNNYMEPCSKEHNDFQGSNAHQHNVGQCVGCGTEWKLVFMCNADLHLSASNWQELEWMEEVDLSYKLPADRCNAWGLIAWPATHPWSWQRGKYSVLGGCTAFPRAWPQCLILHILCLQMAGALLWKLSQQVRFSTAAAARGFTFTQLQTLNARKLSSASIVLYSFEG